MTCFLQVHEETSEFQACLNAAEVCSDANNRRDKKTKGNQQKTSEKFVWCIKAVFNTNPAFTLKTESQWSADIRQNDSPSAGTLCAFTFNTFRYISTIIPAYFYMSNTFNAGLLLVSSILHFSDNPSVLLLCLNLDFFLFWLVPQYFCNVVSLLLL